MEFEELFNEIVDEKKYITSISNEMVKDLYDLVNSYVNDNYIYVGNYDMYYICFNDKLYTIGYFYGPDILYYIRLAYKEEEKMRYINFYDVLNNYINENDYDIKLRIDSIKSQIKLLEDDGVPKNVIQRALKL